MHEALGPASNTRGTELRNYLSGKAKDGWHYSYASPALRNRKYMLQLPACGPAYAHEDGDVQGYDCLHYVPLLLAGFTSAVSSK